MRVFAISDIHVDRRENRAWLDGLSRSDFTDDALIVAGDVSHRFVQVLWALGELRRRFREVAFVPGNHDLWIRREPFADSWAKLESLRDRCRELGVHTGPVRVGGDTGVTLVPISGWYRQPPHPDSLYLPKPGENPDFRGWNDDRFIRWPDEAGDPLGRMTENGGPPAGALPTAGGPVISFSHFMPRSELIFGAQAPKGPDPLPAFNFSRYAGSWEIERLLRATGSRLHVYGHQHRNRRRRLDGVLYVSHCLGYGPERKAGLVGPGAEQPLLLWEDGRPAVADIEEGNPERVQEFLARIAAWKTDSKS